jgi:uncharacterized protein
LSGLILDPWFYVVAIPAVFCTGFSKSGAIAGLGMLAVPIMALTISPVQAAGIMLPILCAMDLLGIKAYRKHIDWQLLRSLLPGALIGIALGALLFRAVSVKWVLIALGLECVMFAGHRVVQAKAIAAAAPGARSFWRALLLSSVAGFTSTLAHAGSPPIAQYLLPLKLPKLQYVGTTVPLFTIINFAKIGPYIWLGLFSTSNLLTSLVLLPLVPLAYWCGVKLMHRLPEKLFYQLLSWGLLLLGLRLLWQGLTSAA